MRNEISINAGWCPGTIGDIVGLHSRYYASRWGFGPYFEAKVAREAAEFVTRLHLHPSQLWCAANGDGQVIGAVAIDGSHGLAEGAHLRWFILDPQHQGRGLGSRLLDMALGFCRERGFERVGLWTFAGLQDARRLYESRGFTLIQELSGQTWGKPVTEQRFELVLTAGRD